MEWKTEITQVIPNNIRIRGYPVQELMEKCDFGQAVYLLLKGELPTPKEGRMMNALLVAVIDHSVMAPSACATRFVASGGSPIQSAVSAGIQALGSHHGGAIEEAQALLMEGVQRAKKENKTIEEIALAIAQEYKEKKKRLPGYGHPYHKEDPRTKELFKLADELGFGGPHIELCKALQISAEKVMERKLTINVDAAMAGVLAEMGFPWMMARGFFIISRCAGLVAHAFEEYTKERPFRAVPLEEVSYQGHEERKIE